MAELDAVVARHPLGILTDPVHDLTRWPRAPEPPSRATQPRPLHHLAAMRVHALQRMAAVDRVEAAVPAPATATRP